MKTLEGNVAVVTGASKGIGAAIALELAARGAAVVVNYAKSRDGAEKVVAEIKRAGGKAIAVGANVAEPKEVDALFATTKETFGKVDILVNNAGVYTFDSIESYDKDAILGLFAVNVVGPMLATKAALPLFPATGGSIVNVSSLVADLAPPMAGPYVSSKGALNSLTKSHAKELAARKIRVNAVSPGITETEGYTAAGFASSDFEKDFVKRTLMGRVGQPADIAKIVAFLVSPDAFWITGSVLDTAGGITA